MSDIPKRVFIVPYRNRIQHKFFFSKYMSFILEDQDDYEVYFTHQCDARTFNRGAIKNIGFLAIKNKYPEHYKDITFIFNDIDTIPFNKIFDYQTVNGVVKHYYGYKYALGGIVVMKGSDFERTNGFPCYWGWGMEDNTLQKRCEALGIKIDRSQFYNIGSPEILQLFDGISRIISKKDPWRSSHDNGSDGLTTIRKLEYSIDDKSDNPNDNIFTITHPRFFVINVFTFLTLIPFEQDQFYNYDLREPKRKIINPEFLRETKKTVASTDDWKNIPYYPTTRERKENIVKLLISQGKKVPESLLREIEDINKSELVSDSFNINLNINTECQEEGYHNQHHRHHNQHHGHHNQHHNQHNRNQYNYQSYNTLPPSPIQNNNNIISRPVPNKYSPEYANYIGQPSRAQASARIRLGGVY